MVEYFIIKYDDKNKKLVLEGIDGRVVDYDPIYRNLILNGRKRVDVAVRIPINKKNFKLNGLVPIELFNEARKQYNKERDV